MGWHVRRKLVIRETERKYKDWSAIFKRERERERERERGRERERSVCVWHDRRKHVIR